MENDPLENETEASSIEEIRIESGPVINFHSIPTDAIKEIISYHSNDMSSLVLWGSLCRECRVISLPMLMKLQRDVIVKQALEKKDYCHPSDRIRVFFPKNTEEFICPQYFEELVDGLVQENEFEKLIQCKKILWGREKLVRYVVSSQKYRNQQDKEYMEKFIAKQKQFLFTYFLPGFFGFTMVFLFWLVLYVDLFRPMMNDLWQNLVDGLFATISFAFYCVAFSTSFYKHVDLLRVKNMGSLIMYGKPNHRHGFAMLLLLTSSAGIIPIGSFIIFVKIVFFQHFSGLDQVGWVPLLTIGSVTNVIQYSVLKLFTLFSSRRLKHNKELSYLNGLGEGWTVVASSFIAVFLGLVLDGYLNPLFLNISLLSFPVLFCMLLPISLIYLKYRKVENFISLTLFLLCVLATLIGPFGIVIILLSFTMAGYIPFYFISTVPIFLWASFWIIMGICLSTPAIWDH